jgi:murein DD-endopeptidase MepM/ murein hydrolase activator NlpD
MLLNLEDELSLRAITARLLPTAAPLSAGTPGSGFGWRIDPFTGQNAMHEGVDFDAPVGTPIVAAGGGTVVEAGWHPSYGQHVDLDHGNGVITRYAHASRLFVKPGDVVRQGQRLAAVGSSG